MTARSARSTLTPWRSRATRAAVAVWGLLAVVAFAATLPAASRAATTVCTGEGCPIGSLDVGAAANLAASGVTVETWGVLATALSVVFAATCFVAGALVLRSRHEVAVATAAMLFAVGLAFPQTMDAAAVVNPSLAPAVAVVTSLCMAALVAWVLTFPDGRLRARASWGVLGVAVIYIVAVPVLAAFAVPWFVVAPAGLFVLSAIAVDALLRLLLRRNRERARGAGSVLVGAAIAASTLGLAGILQGTVITRGTVGDLALQLGLTLAFLALPVTIGVSLLRRGLGDGGGSLLRTLAAGVTATVVLVAFALVYVTAVGAGADATAVAAVGAAALALAAVPLFAGTRALLVRLTRSRSEPASAVHDVSTRFAREASGADAGRAAERVVVEVLGVDEAWVELEPAALGAAPADGHRVPIDLDGVAQANLVVVPRPLQDLTAPREQAALRGVAAYLGAALTAARRQEALRSAHAELLVAREDERRMLRDELHDVLGPVLGSVVLRLRAAERAIVADGARELVEGSRRDVGAMVDAVRRIAYGLRPPALDEHGLIAALELFARSLTGFDVTIEDGLEGAILPTGVQLAAYRITVEAIANAVRHSGGTRCRVVLRLERDRLVVSVEDDGAGTVEEEGVGVLSMRRRAAEVEGTLEADVTETGGVRIVARLPVGSEAVPA